MVSSKKFLLLLVCNVFLLEQMQCYDKSRAGKTWYEAPDIGWSWYVDPHLMPKTPNKQQKGNQQSTQKNGEESTSDSQGSYVYTRQMEQVRKQLEELQAKAILNPTLENVRAFQRVYNDIVNRSTRFEKAWMVSSILSPGSYRESDQPSPKHRKIYQEKAERQLEDDIRTIAKTYGLFFIFKDDCPYCHEMAPIVRQLQGKYHFAIKAISPYGQSIEGFPDAVRDNGTIGQINPEGIYPSLFLVNPHSGQTIPLARGLTSPSELKENFKVVIEFLKEHGHGK